MSKTLSCFTILQPVINVRSLLNKLPSTSRELLTSILSGITFSLLVFWWIYKLDVLPGLHADEAWSGLKAIQFQNDHLYRITGMNNYTGILQAGLAELSFGMFGKGVLQLRLGGVALNLAGLIILFFSISTKTNRVRSLLFLLMIAQSALFVLSPRIAWEVNSFTLFLFSITFASFLKIRRKPFRKNHFWVFLFLLGNLLGTYNHVLFSCIPVSVFFGTLLWEARYKSRQYSPLVVLLAVNCFNLIVVFLSMRYYLESIANQIGYIVFSAFLLLVFTTKCYFLLISRVKRFNLNITKKMTIAIVGLGISVFAIFHGIAFFQVLSAYKIILQIFSYECSTLTEITLSMVGCVVLACFLIQLAKDLKLETIPVEIYWISCYLGIFCAYTISCSFRYYLSIYVLMALYVACRISFKTRVSRFFVATIIIGFIIMQFMWYDIFIVGNFPLKAIDFKIGNRQKETTAHFLPKQPIIDFLKTNKTGQIQYLIDEPYFVEQPILFYKTINPWDESNGKGIFLDYDHTSYKTGFLLYTQDD